MSICEWFQSVRSLKYINEYDVLIVYKGKRAVIDQKETGYSERI